MPGVPLGSVFPHQAVKCGVPRADHAFPVLANGTQINVNKLISARYRNLSILFVFVMSHLCFERNVREVIDRVHGAV